MNIDKKNISEIRNDYKLKQLDKSHISSDPIAQMELWLNEAIDSSLYEATAMTVSTVSGDGRPSSRILLLKGITHQGFIFFTNYKSRKGKDLTKNPYGAINFFWPELERQVRIEGKIEKVSEKESDEYFQSRPRGSQLGASVSPQSEVINEREKIERERDEMEKKYEGKIIPRPLQWGGYILKPDYFEFWQGRQDRLHDRIAYTLNGNEWKVDRLAP
jgi:pyridoxamine 5'-phosphate oxidase